MRQALRENSQTDYSILARVHGEEVVFADDIPGDARSGDGQWVAARRA